MNGSGGSDGFARNSVGSRGGTEGGGVDAKHVEVQVQEKGCSYVVS